MSIADQYCTIDEASTIVQLKPMQALSSTACPILLQDVHMDPSTCVLAKESKSNHKNAIYIACDCVRVHIMSNSITCAVPYQQFIACTDSQEASLPVCYIQ